MGFVQEKRANPFELIGGAFAALRDSWKEVGAYLLIFAVLNLLPIYDWEFGWAFILMLMLGYFLAQYLLYQAMLRRAGLLQKPGFRVLQFIAMAVVLILPISIGFNVFWIPGLILVAKWIMAPAYLVAREENPFRAMGESWRASEFNTLNLTIAVFLMGVIWAFAIMPLMIIFELFGGLASEATWVVMLMHLLPVLLAGLSMSAYRQLGDDTSALTEVFS